MTWADAARKVRPMTHKPAATLHVFRAGTHTATDGNAYAFSEADIADLVESYDPQLARAPLVIGHPKIDDPAYGWAADFACDGGDVFATPEAVEPQFAELVNAQRFSAISLSVYLPNSPGNPKPGHFYPRHIGFLGAQPPAVKGLQRPQFAAGDGAVAFAMPLPHRVSSLGYFLKRLFQGLRDRAIETDGTEKAEQLIPQWCIDGIADATADDDTNTAVAAFAATAHTPEIKMDNANGNTADFAEQQRQLDTQKTQLEQREQALKAREDAARRADAVEFAEGLVQAGKLLPRQQAGIVELLLSLPAGAALNFAEADGEAATDHAPADVLRGLLNDLPVRVDFAEKSAGAVVTAIPNFAAPAGVSVAASDAELYGKAKAWQQQNPGASWLAAVAAAGG